MSGPLGAPAAIDPARFFALAPDPMVVVAGGGLIAGANPAFAALVGDAAARPGQPLGAVMARDLATAPERFTAGIRRHDGAPRLYAWTVARDGDLRYLWGHDVTEAARKDREMREAQRLAACGSFEVELATGAVYWSEEMYKIFGVPLGETITVATVMGATHPDDRPAAMAIMGAGAAGEVTEVDFEHRLIRPDGVERRFHLQAVFVAGEDGRPQTFFGAGQDVTEKRAAEAERAAHVAALERASAHKDQFLGILSHELRTPLNAILGFGSILEDGLAGPLNEAQARYVGRIMGSSDAMLAQVNDLLDMSRVQAGKFMIDKAPLDLHGLLTGLGAADVVVEPPAAPLPRLMADPQRVGQIVENLLGNARKYAPGAPIRVRAAAAPGHLRVEVEDQGPGIDPADHVRIFEPFTQVDMSDTRGAGGVGLGLSIVRALVEAHGGTVGLDSTLGAGATFWFTLPLE